MESCLQRQVAESNGVVCLHGRAHGRSTRVWKHFGFVSFLLENEGYPFYSIILMIFKSFVAMFAPILKRL